MRPPLLIAAILAVGSLGSCEEAPTPRDVDVGLVDLALRSAQPSTLLPGTRIVVTGDSFVDNPWGQSFLVLEGLLGGDDEHLFRLRLPARFVDYDRLEIDITPEAFAEFGDVPTTFEGVAVVEAESAVDGRTYRSGPVDVHADVVDSLSPDVTLAQTEAVIFPNEPMIVRGDGLLLPGEGESIAHLEGCFTPLGADACTPIEPIDVPVRATTELDRSEGRFDFVPEVAGIEPGRFEGTISLRNVHAHGTEVPGEAADCVYDLEQPILYGADTLAASLGQYITIEGAGFVGTGDANTALQFTGTFTPDRTGIASPIEELLLPEFVDGRTVRYVVNEDDNLGRQLDIRYGTGTFEGLITPITAWRDQEVTGDPTPLGFRLEAVTQVVYIRFLPAYRESLRHYGLRAVDQAIRERAVDVIERDFRGINIDVRTQEPVDFSLFAQVEIGGPDPNGLGLLGYDNTPGKDTENLRLYDRIGGVNALTQEDGFPGFGGVFIESMFGYSEDPGTFAEPLKTDPLFDALMDPFRPDRGGLPVLAADLGGELPDVDGADCPANDDDRERQVACAVYVMGNLIGTTVSHELGHSLGLADPYGAPTTYHNSGDEPDRLMDGDRPFAERAQLGGEGPSRFCVDEYDYLRSILPSDDPYDTIERPGCY